jgi:transcriptional regulator with XRE-family HTH domain
MFIAPRLRKIREIRGWKQAAVAEAMHTTQQSYSSLEQGTGFPKMLFKIHLESFLSMIRIIAMCIIASLQGIRSS